MLLTLALRTDRERVYARATKVFAPEEIAEARASAVGLTIPTCCWWGCSSTRCAPAWPDTPAVDRYLAGQGGGERTRRSVVGLVEIGVGAGGGEAGLRLR
jgi:hypothetical protein